jgi:hypothetical protein
VSSWRDWDRLKDGEFRQTEKALEWRYSEAFFVLYCWQVGVKSDAAQGTNPGLVRMRI